MSINENQSEYNGQSESWIVSQWANDTAKVIPVDRRKCDKSRGSWFQSLRLIGLEGDAGCLLNQSRCSLPRSRYLVSSTDWAQNKVKQNQSNQHYFRDSIENSSNFILFSGWIKALSMSPTTTRLYSFFFFPVLSVVLKEVCSLNPRLHLWKKCKFCALKL